MTGPNWACILILATTLGATWPTAGNAPFGVLLAPHEGHAPLPTKGVEINLERGTVLVTASARDALGIETAEVVKRAGEERLLAYARVVTPWQHHALVAPRISGRIVGLQVQPGEAVVAGQILAELTAPQLDELQTELLDAKRQVELSSKLVEHFRSLGGEAVSERQVQTAEATHAANLRRQQIVRLKLLSLGLSAGELEKLEADGSSALVPTLTLRSPIAGHVQHSDLSIGRVVVPAEHLFEVIDHSVLWCRIGILEQDLHRVSKGQTVEIRLTARPDQVWTGKIQVVEATLDETTHLGTAWVDLQNQSTDARALLPGMFGEAQLILPASDELMTVPARAVARNGAERFVLVQEEATDKASQFIRKNVVVVRSLGDLVQIRGSGVFPGDRVVTVGAHELFNFFVQGVLRVSPEASESIGLRIEKVRSESFEEGFFAEGAVELAPGARDRISAPLDGQISRILVERGQSLKAGDVVAELSSLELQDWQQEMLLQNIRLAQLEAQIRGLQSVAAGRGTAERQLWEVRASADELRNQLQFSQRKLVQAGLTEEQVAKVLATGEPVATFPLRATIDGTLAGFDRALGESVSEGEPVFEVHDLRDVWVRAWVGEQESTQLGEGLSARIRFASAPGFVAEAKLVRNSRILDPASQSQSVWLKLEQRPESPLHHNMLARVRFVTEQSSPVLSVALESLVREGASAFVFVRADDGKFERRWVETGRVNDQRVEILSGLQTDEQVAAWGAADLQTAYAAIQ